MYVYAIQCTVTKSNLAIYTVKFRRRNELTRVMVFNSPAIDCEDVFIIIYQSSINNAFKSQVLIKISKGGRHKMVYGRYRSHCLHPMALVCWFYYNLI